MARPIIWALGTAGLIGVMAAGGAERMALVAAKLPDRTERSERPPDGGRTVILSADLAGHFTVHPSLDGRRIRMLVDTGASQVALSYEDALKVGLRPEARDFTRKVSTANGIVAVAPVRLGEVRVGEILVRNVDAVVLPDGRLGTSLLGMSFLKRIGGFEIARGQLTLRG